MIECAKRADAAGFSSPGTIVAWSSQLRPFIGLAARGRGDRADRTHHRYRHPPVPHQHRAGGQQAATIQDLSGGRLVLGVAVGGREDDFEAGGAPFEGRVRRLEEMLDEMKRIWAGEERGFAGAIGPDVSSNPPRILVGGQVDAAFRRAAEYGDGWISAAAPEMVSEAREKVEAAFRDAAAARADRLDSRLLLARRRSREPGQSTIGDYYLLLHARIRRWLAGTARARTR